MKGIKPDRQNQQVSVRFPDRMLMQLRVGTLYAQLKARLRIVRKQEKADEQRENKPLKER